jgi:hypothetical protein
MTEEADVAIFCNDRMNDCFIADIFCNGKESRLPFL